MGKSWRVTRCIKNLWDNNGASLYQAKQSIQEIVFISQYVQHVEVITRTPSGWEYQEYGHEESFPIVSLNMNIHVSDIYRRLSCP